MGLYMLVAFITFYSLPAFSLLIEDTVISGKVKRYDDKVVTILDRYGKTHTVQRTQISKKIKLDNIKKLSVRVKVKPEQFAFSKLPYELNNISKLKKPEMEKLLLAYMLFLKGVDRQVQKTDAYKINKGDEKYTQLGHFFFQNAYAEDPTTYTCFWGGWPTSSSGSGPGANCERPFRSQMHEQMSADNPIRYNGCGGGQSVYRCNPVIFGPSTQTHSGSGLGANVPATGAPSVHVRQVPVADANNGICVVAAPHEIVERCLAASAPNFYAILERIRANPAAFTLFANGVADFCRQARNATNSMCGNLRERLAAIDFGLKEKVQRTVDGSCTHQEHGSLRENIGSGSGNSCPGDLCYVRATCNPADASTETSPLEVTAVCGCAHLGSNSSANGSEPDNGQLLACINDQSIDAINASNNTGPEGTDSGGETQTQ